MFCVNALPRKRARSVLGSKNHSLASKVDWEIREETGLRQINAVTDRYGNRVEYEYAYDSSNPTILDSAKSSSFIARIDAQSGLLAYSTTPEAEREVTFEQSYSGYSRPVAVESRRAGSASLTELEYNDPDFETTPTRVTTWISQPPAAAELVSDATIDLDAFGRVVQVDDLLSGSVVYYEYLNDTCPYSATIKSISAFDPAGREDTVENEFYNEADPTNQTDPSGPKYSYLSPTVKSVVSNDGEPTESASTYAYDDFGRVTAVADDHGRSINYIYNAHTGRVTDTWSILPPENDHSHIKYEYDAFGAMIRLEDQLGHSWHYFYDSYRRLAAVKNPRGEVTAYMHSPWHRARHADPNVVWPNPPAPNPENDPHNSTGEVGSPLTIYDGGCGCTGGGGRRVYRTIRFSADTDFGPDGDPEPRSDIEEHIVEVQDFYYDSGGNVGYVEVFATGTGEPNDPWYVNNNKRTIKIERDQIGRVLAIHDSGTNNPFDMGAKDIDAGATRFEYYEDPFLPNYLQLKKKIEPDGFEQEFAYDNWGRAVFATNQLGLASAVSFESTFPFRTETTKSHLGGATTLERSDGTVAGAGRWGTVNKISRQFNSGGVAGGTLDSLMTFDSQDRLASLTHHWASSNPFTVWKAEHSSHDTATHNRLNETITLPPDPFISQAQNQVVQSYGYNARGALTSWSANGTDINASFSSFDSYEVDKAHNVTDKGSFENVYNSFNQLQQSLSGGNPTNDYEWDSRGNLKTRDDAPGGGGETNYYYDEFNRLQWIQMSGSPEKSVGYTRNAGGQLIRRRTWDATPQTPPADPIVTQTSDRRTFFSGVWPSLTLLGDRPGHAHIEEFSNLEAFNQWEVYDDFPNHTATWWRNTSNSGMAQANAGGGAEGTLLWPEGFEQGAGDFTLTTKMNLGDPPGTFGGSKLVGAISGGGGVLLNLGPTGEEDESEYYRAYVFWTNDPQGPIKLQATLERETYVVGQPAATTDNLGYSSLFDTTTIPNASVTMRVRYQTPATSSTTYGRIIVDAKNISGSWVQLLSHSLASEPNFAPENRVGLYAVGQTVLFYETAIDRTQPWSGAAPKELGHGMADWAPTNAEPTAGSDASGAVTSWVSFAAPSGTATATWDGTGASQLGQAEAGRPALGLLLRRDFAVSGGHAANMRVEVDLDTSAGLRTVSYDHTASTPSIAGAKATIPWKGDIEENYGAWRLAAFDPTEDAKRSFTTLTSTGRVRAVRVYGYKFSIGGFWAWERLPEVIYNGGVEWRLHKRWHDENNPTTSAASYLVKTRAVLKNTRGDAVLFAGLNPEAQASDYQFFDAYGKLIAKGSGTSATGVQLTTTLGATTRADFFRLGMTGKPWDPDAGLYHFGFRERGDGSNGMVGWLQADPAGMVDGPNVYQFVLGDPVNGVDLDGLQTGSGGSGGSSGFSPQLHGCDDSLEGTSRNFILDLADPLNPGLPIELRAFAVELQQQHRLQIQFAMSYFDRNSKRFQYKKGLKAFYNSEDDASQVYYGECLLITQILGDLLRIEYLNHHEDRGRQHPDGVHYSNPYPWFVDVQLIRKWRKDGPEETPDHWGLLLLDEYKVEVTATRRSCKWVVESGSNGLYPLRPIRTKVRGTNPKSVPRGIVLDTIESRMFSTDSWFESNPQWGDPSEPNNFWWAVGFRADEFGPSERWVPREADSKF